MYCSHCGQEIPDNSKFCPRCGQALQAPQTGSQAQAGTTQQAQVPHMAAHPVASDKTSGVSVPVIVTLIGALMMLISVFMPLYRASVWGIEMRLTYFNAASAGADSGTATGFMIVGILILIVSVLIALLRIKTKRILVIILSVIALLFGFLMFAACESAISDSYGLAQLGSSTILLIIGSIVSIVGCVRKG